MILFSLILQEMFMSSYNRGLLVDFRHLILQVTNSINIYAPVTGQLPPKSRTYFQQTLSVWAKRFSYHEAIGCDGMVGMRGGPVWEHGRHGGTRFGRRATWRDSAKHYRCHQQLGNGDTWSLRHQWIQQQHGRFS